MKIEDLTKLGIAEDVAKQVVSLADAEVTAEKTKLADKEAELTMATEKIGELAETVKKFDGVDVEKLKADLAAANQKYAEDTAALKLDNALSSALAESGAKDRDIIKGLIDKSLIKVGDDGKVIGLTEQLDRLKTDKAFLFDAAEGEQMTVDTGIQHTGSTEAVTTAQARAVMGLPTETK